MESKTLKIRVGINIPKEPWPAQRPDQIKFSNRMNKQLHPALPLIQSRKKAMTTEIHERQKERWSRWHDYIPLIAIVVLTVFCACAKQIAYGGWNWTNWMHDFMGFFLVVFSMFKFFDMEGFANGFQMYDLLAKRFRPYARIYPFIELALGLGYLSHWRPMLIYATTVVILVFGSIGVLR